MKEPHEESLRPESRSDAKYFEHLAHENTTKAESILMEADQLAEELGLDEELLNSLVVGSRR